EATQPEVGSLVFPETQADEPCQDAVVNDTCFVSVQWAMTRGIHEHPEWYPTLSKRSTFAEFQEVLHRSPGSRYDCPMPCPATGGAPSFELEWGTKEADMQACPPCTPTRRDTPDVVIPFYERDLCKVGYTVTSIGVHDPHKLLGRIILMWVSTQPAEAFQSQIDKVIASVGDSHEVVLLDVSGQVNSGHAGGWFAQQVFKLKVASRVKSDYYVVMDAKNTLIRDVEEDTFFTNCHLGRIFGEFEAKDIPQPHSQWYQASARVLNVEPPTKGKWPSSITPMVIHTQTVLDMLSDIGEDVSVSSLCAGPLCDMLGVGSANGEGATEFTMYVLAARARPDFECALAVTEMDPNEPPAISLWRGIDEAADAQMIINVDNCREISEGKTLPVMFGAQTGALDGIVGEQRSRTEEALLKIFTRAGLHDSNKTSTEALIECVAGDAEGLVGPVHDKHAEDEPDDFDGVDAKDAEEQIIKDSIDKTEAEMAASSSASLEDFCCTGTMDEADFCGKCWTGAREGANSYCGSSEDRCASCGGSRWCQGRKDVDGSGAGGIDANASSANASAGGAKDPKVGSMKETKADAKQPKQPQSTQEASRVDANASNATDRHGDRHKGSAATPLCENLGCGPYDPDWPCQCNEVCGQYGNCCIDFAAVCPVTVMAIMRRDDERGGSLRKAAAGAAPALLVVALLGTAAAAAALLGLARRRQPRQRGARAAARLPYEQLPRP
ncbi:unnamed protein product, partial [Prorocentrum cordatum]